MFAQDPQPGIVFKDVVEELHSLTRPTIMPGASQDDRQAASRNDGFSKQRSRFGCPGSMLLFEHDPSKKSCHLKNPTCDGLGADAAGSSVDLRLRLLLLARVPATAAWRRGRLEVHHNLITNLQMQNPKRGV